MVIDISYDVGNEEWKRYLFQNLFHEKHFFRGTKRVLIFNVTTYRPAHTLLELLKDCLFNEAIFCSNIISCKAGEASLGI